MIYEFYGLPGCGKSTICQSLYDKKEFMPLPKIKEFKKHEIIRALFSFSFIKYFFNSLLLYISSDSKDFKNLLLLNSIFLKYKIVSFRKSNEVFCVDHGIIQTISSMNFYSLKSKKSVNRIVNIIDKMSHIKKVYLYSDDTIEILDRIVHRKDNKRISKIGKIEVLKVLEYQIDLFNFITSLLSSVIKLDAFNSIEESVNKIIKYLGE